MARIALVERLSGLNARHISATSRLAGMEIELSGPCGASAKDVRTASSTFPERSGKERLERDRRELERSMADIERERDALERELLEIDERLASLDRAGEDAEGNPR